MEVDDGSNMLCEIGFGTRWLNERRFHWPRDDVARSNQTRGAMPDLFKFLPLHMPRHHRQRGMCVFSGSNPGHLITRMNLNPHVGQGRRFLVEVTDSLNLRAKLLRIVTVRMQPVPNQVRFEIGLLFKKRPTWRGEIFSTIFCFMASRASAEGVQWVIGTSSSVGLSQAILMIWATGSGVNVHDLPGR